MHQITLDRIIGLIVRLMLKLISREFNKGIDMNYNNMDMHSYGSGSGQNYAGECFFDHDLHF